MRAGEISPAMHLLLPKLMSASRAIFTGGLLFRILYFADLFDESGGKYACRYSYHSDSQEGQYDAHHPSQRGDRIDVTIPDGKKGRCCPPEA